VNASAYTHRFRFGQFDSICWNCFRTVSTQQDESALKEDEERHICNAEDMLQMDFDRSQMGKPRPN
jgi:hypothetical protein